MKRLLSPTAVLVLLAALLSFFPVSAALATDSYMADGFDYITDTADFTTFGTLIDDVYDPGAYRRTIDLIKYEKTTEMFTTNMSGQVSWFSSNSEIVKVTGFTQYSCGVAYLKPGNATLTLSDTYYVGDRLCNTQIVMNITVKSELPMNNTQHFAGGSGTAQDPYLISTKEHLSNINSSEAYLKAHFKLVNDIIFDAADFEVGGAFYNDGCGWWPIATPLYWSEGHLFSGVFDGNGFIISGLYSGYNGSGQLASATVGLFGTSIGTIKNLGIENSEFQAFSQNRSNGNYSSVGAFVGLNGGAITNCYVKNSYIGGDVAGGIVGEMINSVVTPVITDCYSGNIKFFMAPAYVSSSFHVYGGIVGNLSAGSVNRTYSSSFIYAFTFDGKSYYPTAVGGLIGNKGASASVTNSYYFSTVPNGIYNPSGNTGTVKLTAVDMQSLSKFPAFSSATWYISSDDVYKFPQLLSFERIKRTLFVSTPPAKTEYSVGDSIDLTGAQLTVVQPDGSFETVTITDKTVVLGSPNDIIERDTVYIEGFDSSAAGAKVLRVSYSDLVTNFEVYVVDEDEPGDNEPGDDVIVFEDPVLEEQVRFWLGKPTGAITKDDALSFDNLNLDNYEIESLSGLEHFTNISSLRLNNNKISDISPLAAMTEMTTLRLMNNHISDLSPLAGLTKMELLQLNYNDISDISALAAMTELDFLTLEGNNISDISVFSGLNKLRVINLKNNEVRDISKIAGLTLLEQIVLEGNYLDTTAGSPAMVIIDELIARPVAYVSYLPQNTPEFTYGDVNEDGTVSGKDVVLLAQHLAYWPVGLSANQLAAADVNVDDTVDGKDVVRLAQYLAYWQVELGK